MRRNHQPFDSIEAGAPAQLIGRGQLVHRCAIRARHRLQRVAGGHAVIAPFIALVFGNLGNALLEDSRRAGRQMQIERCIGRRNRAQKAWIQRHQLFLRRSHQI